MTPFNFESLSGPAISDELILCLRFPPCYHKDGETVKVQEEKRVPQRSNQKLHVGGAQTKEMVLHDSL